MIMVLAGGVGAARFLSGLIQVVNPADVVAVVNTGDDTELHGLSMFHCEGPNRDPDQLPQTRCR